VNYRKNTFSIYAAAAVVVASTAGLVACSGNTQASETVTAIQTVTAIETVTATATVTAVETVTAAPQEPQTSGVIAKLPADVEGENAQALSDELDELGYTHVVWNSDSGNSVFMLSNWTVTSLEKAGQDVSTSKTIVVHVTKPGQ